MSTEVTYPHIEKIEGSSARLKRLPRVRVAQIVIDYLNHGWSADEICIHYPHLKPAEVHSAMAYYFDHQPEIDAEIEEEQRLIAESRRNAPPTPAEQRLRRQSRYRKKPPFLSGGGGLVSTARDYLRFCQMLLNGGELEGTRLLRKETVQSMIQNQLPEEAMPLTMSGLKLPGVGFGLGFGVVVSGDKANPIGVAGEYFWGGAASTHFWISPRHELAVLVLEQY